MGCSSTETEAVMIELSGFGSLLKAINLLYWIVAALVIAVTWRRAEGRRSKILLSVVAASLFLVLPVLRISRAVQLQTRYAEARALFDERCRTSGEKILKTVSDVDGIFLLRPRPAGLNLSNQYELDDPYASDFRGSAYIVSFLMGRNPDGSFTEKNTNGAFRFVETADPQTGGVLRWTPVLTPRASRDAIDISLKKEIAAKRRSKYGVTWSDLSTREDRDHWIAGSSLRIVDLETNNTIAERIGYMFDAGLGDQTGGRSPWAYATYNACPAFDRGTAGTPMKASRDRGFVLRVLSPYQGD
jgi:hypothetical protein